MSTWSYSGDPSASDKDAVRWFSGDRFTSDQLVSDEEIAFTLTLEPDSRLAAAEVCEALAAGFRREADASDGDLSESASQKAKAFEAQAIRLRKMAKLTAAPIFGGLSISEKRTLREDTDLIQPSFTIGQFDNPEIPNERDGAEFGLRPIIS